jgi:hypothetical protein
MSINFNELPKDRPNQPIANGFYVAEIVKAEMRDPSATAKSKLPYLNLQLSLTDAHGAKKGTLFDKISEESTFPALRFKLKRFMIAIGAEGLNCELKDLIKLCSKKKVIIDVNQDKQDPPRPQVNIFDNEVYYPLSDFDKIFADADSKTEYTDPTDTEEDLPFETSDANTGSEDTANDY